MGEPVLPRACPLYEKSMTPKPHRSLPMPFKRALVFVAATVAFAVVHPTTLSAQDDFELADRIVPLLFGALGGGLFQVLNPKPEPAFRIDGEALSSATQRQRMLDHEGPLGVYYRGGLFGWGAKSAAGLVTAPDAATVVVEKRNGDEERVETEKVREVMDLASAAAAERYQQQTASATLLGYAVGSFFMSSRQDSSLDGDTDRTVHQISGVVFAAAAGVLMLITPGKEKDRRAWEAGEAWQVAPSFGFSEGQARLGWSGSVPVSWGAR